MDDTFVTTVYVILADMERALQLPIKYKPKMAPAEILTLGLYRKRIEFVNSQLESMGVEHLKARTHAGLEIKLHASLLAVFCTNADLN